MHKLPFTTLRHSKGFLKYFAKEISEKLNGDFDLAIGLQANNFNNTVKIKFHDGSELKIRDAFFVLKEIISDDEDFKDEDFNEYAVFTEHYGYFFFYSESVKKIKEKEIKRIVYNNLK